MYRDETTVEWLRRLKAEKAAESPTTTGVAVDNTSLQPTTSTIETNSSASSRAHLEALGRLARVDRGAGLENVFNFLGQNTIEISNPHRAVPTPLIDATHVN